MLFIGKYAVSHENNYEDQSGLVNFSMEITSQLQHVILVGEKHTKLLNIHKIPISEIKIWQIFHISYMVRRHYYLLHFLESLTLAPRQVLTKLESGLLDLWPKFVSVM